MRPMIKEIHISLAGNCWIDRENNLYIGDADDLIVHVNSNKLFVLNDDVFLYREEFWYY